MLRGLPIGHGEVWHDHDQRRLLIGLAIASLLPFVALALPGWGWTTVDTYVSWVAAPLLGLVAALAAFSWTRYPSLAKRIAIGLCVGVLGALTYDTARLVAESFGWISASGALGVTVMGVGPSPSWSVLAETTFMRWVIVGALWGLAYALVAGKASWGWGVFYGLSMGTIALAAAFLAPQGAAVLPPLTLAGVAGWLGGAALYGAVLGALNQVLQPDVRFGGKIIFLRDYQARVGQRK